MSKNPVTIAAAQLGSTSALARALGLTYQAVRKWERAIDDGRLRGIPAERAVEIERLTHGRVTRQMLRPDLWPTERTAA
ncbi:MAG: chaperone [Gammaproteobacteria bacterium]|nr:chaperone [Gammaproteobacteria bacterium]